MNVLVTGGSGFLGSHIVDACIERGDRVRALVRPSSDATYLRSRGVDLAFGDLAPASNLDEATRGIDVVYHSAARVSDYGTREDFWHANVVGTDRLLDAARKNGVRRFVFISSPSVVAEDCDHVDIDESHPYPKQFLNLYSETKAISEQRVLAENGKGIVTCAIRPRGVWGPRDRTGWMPKLIGKMAQGRLPNLWSDRKVYASLTYCENAALACVLAGQTDAIGGKAYFVTDGVKTDVAAFATVLADLFRISPPQRRVSPSVLRFVASVVEAFWDLTRLSHKRPPPLSRYSLALLTRTGTYDIAAATRDFGYRPRVSPETGLEALKRWVDEIGGVSPFVRHAR